MKDDRITVFLHWNDMTKTCYNRYKNGLNCDGCPNSIACSKQPWNKNPYGIKNIKYAMLQTLANVGEPK